MSTTPNLPPEAQDAIFHIKPENHYHGAVSMELPGGDLMGVLWREPGNPEWYFRIRFRWYRDNKTFDSKDIKRVYTLTITPRPGETQDHIAARAMGALQDIASAAGVARPDWILAEGGSGEKMMELFSQRPEAHVKTYPAPKEGQS
jgi:hypothetical protein